MKNLYKNAPEIYKDSNEKNSLLLSELYKSGAILNLLVLDHYGVIDSFMVDSMSTI